MWGNLRHKAANQSPVGSIPSYVGEPPRLSRPRALCREHPLVCGGTYQVRAGVVPCVGASPRMWGNRLCPRGRPSGVWSIPSYVGEPCPMSAMITSGWEHPLVCGGTLQPIFRVPPMPGASPRMWGNQEDERGFLDHLRSIPSYVGEPSGEAGSWRPVKEHPFVCGGTNSAIRHDLGRLGASPRMWGNLRHEAANQSPVGSIPSYVGEPRTATRHCTEHEEHPLVCGGTTLSDIVSLANVGASPRMWGNPLVAGRQRAQPRSIPSYVGEPQGS